MTGRQTVILSVNRIISMPLDSLEGVLTMRIVKEVNARRYAPASYTQERIDTKEGPVMKVVPEGALAEVVDRVCSIFSGTPVEVEARENAILLLRRTLHAGGSYWMPPLTITEEVDLIKWLERTEKAMRDDAGELHHIKITAGLQDKEAADEDTV